MRVLQARLASFMLFGVNACRNFASQNRIKHRG
nr:MAG TPA: hypothetical protein [Caudoviricetes sp.]